MNYLTEYKQAIGKTVKEVREYSDSSFDDTVEFTLMIFTDDTALLIVHQASWTTGSGIIEPDNKMLDKTARRALGL